MIGSSKSLEISLRKRRAIGVACLLGSIGLNAGLAILFACEFYPLLALLVLGFPL